jgi:hypothetical protein
MGVSGYYPVSGQHFLLTGIWWTTIRYYLVSGKTVSGTSLVGDRETFENLGLRMSIRLNRKHHSGATKL